MEVETGKLLPLEIPNKTQAPEWMPDGSGFVYQNLKDPKDPYSGRVLYHRMGTDVAADPILFRQYTKEENEKLATTWGPGGSLSRDGRWLTLVYWTGTRSNDLWVADFERFLATGKLEKREVAIGQEATSFGVVDGDTLFVQTNLGAPNGRVDAYDLRSKAAGGAWKPQTVVAERPGMAIQSISVARGLLAVDYLKNATSVIEVFDASAGSAIFADGALSGTPAKSLGELAMPGIGSAGLATEPDRTEAYLKFTSFNYPTTIFRVDLGRPALEPELWERPPVPVDPSTVEVKQVWYSSKDGTKVSMFVVHRKGLALDGNNPTLLTGYGGFNVSETPNFSATMFQWFEAGGVMALPNLRGGGEYGDAWHEAGMLAKKQNVFDDFIAAAEWLIAERYTSPAKLAIAGGSNGGLLTGAALIQRPELFRAALVAVPLLDMLRYQNFLMARYWVPEYGSAEDAAQFDFLHAYSPYQNVKSGTPYPAVLLTAGENDTRVHALHARKMAAALQAASASDPADEAGPPLGRPRSRPRPGQAPQPPHPRRRRPAHLLHVAARDAAEELRRAETASPRSGDVPNPVRSGSCLARFPWVLALRKRAPGPWEPSVQPPLVVRRSCLQYVPGELGLSHVPRRYSRERSSCLSGALGRSGSRVGDHASNRSPPWIPSAGVPHRGRVLRE